MWCYHKPDFEALLISELQRQQQCSQFCDTLLKAEGLSVPAHSCILSAISPLFASSLSSMPVLPAGQNRLLEFRALGSCSLLHVVRLLYSGKMAGEGEKEKQEAISAAAKLGIHGLVEVTQTQWNYRNGKEEGQYKEVGVQTETLMLKEADTRQGGQRKEVWDDRTLQWKEGSPSSGRETWTQTEEQCAPASQSSTSFDTIDMNTLQSLRQTDSHLLLPPIPYFPVSLVYEPDENQASAPSLSSAITVAQAPPAAGHGSVPTVLLPSAPPPINTFPSQAPQSAAGPQTWCSESHATVAGEEVEYEGLEKFEDNITGFISYFLNAEKEKKGSCARPAGNGRGSRRRGMAEAKARSAQARGRGRGRLTQTVDVQDVGASSAAKMFQHKWGMQPNRTMGQGGGAVGRKLCVKTRAVLISGRSVQRRRYGTAQDFIGGANTQSKYKTRGSNRRTVHKMNEDGPLVPRAQGSGAKSSSLPSASTPLNFFSTNPPSLSTQLPVACTPLPPPAPPAPPALLYQPEHIEHLLEEVMSGLDIISSSNEQSQSAVLSSPHTYPQNKQQATATQGAAVAEGTGDSAACDMPVLQQQAEGELSDILDHLLQSFATRAEKESDSRSSKEPNAGPSKRKKNKIHITSCITPARGAAKPSQITEQQQKGVAGILPKNSQTSADCAVTPTHPNARRRVNAPAKRRKRIACRLSLDKQTVKEKKPELPSDGREKCHHLLDKQLQQMPVVKLERNGPLPVNITLRRHSDEESALTFSIVKHPGDGGLEKNQMVLKNYPITARRRRAHVLSNVPLPGETPSDTPSPTCQKYPRRGRTRNNGHLPRLSDADSALRNEGQQIELTQDRCDNHEEESTVRPQEEKEKPARRRRKRRKESDDDDDDARWMKRISPEPLLQSPQLDCEDAEVEEVDVETVSSQGYPPPSHQPQITGGDADEKPGGRHADEDVDSVSDEVIDVDGESSDRDHSGDVERFCLLTGAAAGPSRFSEVEPLVCLPPDQTSMDSGGNLTDDRGEHIDVIGWTDCSEGEDEDEVDVDGNTGHTPTWFNTEL